MSEACIQTAAAASQLTPDNGEIEIDLTPSTGKIPEVPDGVYPLTLNEIGRAPSQYGGQVPVLKFTIDGRQEDGTLNLFVSKARWTLILTALKVLHNGASRFKMKHEELVGRKCQGVVQNVPAKKDPTKKFPRITTLLPVAA